MVSGSGDARMWRSHDRQRQATCPLPNVCRGRFGAAIVDDDDFKARFVVLLRKRSETGIKRAPIVVDGDNDAQLKPLFLGPPALHRCHCRMNVGWQTESCNHNSRAGILVVIRMAGSGTPDSK